MTEEEAYEAVCQRWKSVWDTLHSTDPGDPSYAPYVFANRRFPEPQPDPPTTWARVTMRQSDSQQHTLGAVGARRFLRDANVWVQLYSALGVGERASRALVDDVRQVFEGASFSGVDSAGAVRMITLGVNPDGRLKVSDMDGEWYEIVCVCPVTYYETR